MKGAVATCLMAVHRDRRVRRGKIKRLMVYRMRKVGYQSGGMRARNLSLTACKTQRGGRTGYERGVQLL